MPSALVEVRELTKSYTRPGSLFSRSAAEEFRAVNRVSLDIFAGETLGVVGESGCGKTTLGRMILRLLEPSSGSVRFDGQDVLAASTPQMRRLRRDMQIVFQDPFASLNPRMRVFDILSEPWRIHGDLEAVNGGSERQRAAELLRSVGLDESALLRYPHEFSGGQRQRIGIARALALQPKLIVCDEPVSALDVSVQAQILNLLKDLQSDFALTYVFISHDLSVIRQISDRIAVMYLGRVVEIGNSEQLYLHPRHPYTAALLSAVPKPETNGGPHLGSKQRIVLGGDVPSPVDPPQACIFHPRCPRFQPGHCDVEEPLLRPFEGDHEAACHYPIEHWPMTEDEIRRPSLAGSGSVR
jgi:oligopeptide/dipeptide ABC transporter ATP-binding protein